MDSNIQFSPRFLTTPADRLKLGFYLYDKTCFVSKQEAMDHAIAKADFFPNIQFIFNDDVYRHLDWSQDPQESLQELYRKRAKQLRETYPYLVLLYSGGADSTNVLQTFLKAGIFLDEIQTFYPVSALERLTPVYDRQHRWGIFFEYHLAAHPMLKVVQALSPKTKIEVIDTVPFIQSNWKENFLADNEGTLRINHNLILPLLNYQIVNHNNNHPRSNIGVIYGADRARPGLHDGVLSFCFSDDGVAAHHSKVYQPNARKFTPEQFYWTRDFPWIPLKQMHDIKKELECNRQLYDILAAECSLKQLQHGRLASERLINRIIYPDWDNLTYQKDIKLQDDSFAELLLEPIVGPSALDHVKGLLRQRVSHNLTKYSRLQTGIKIGSNSNYKFVSARTFSRRYSLGSVTRPSVLDR